MNRKTVRVLTGLALLGVTGTRSSQAFADDYEEDYAVTNPTPEPRPLPGPTEPPPRPRPTPSPTPGPKAFEDGDLDWWCDYDPSCWYS